MKLHYYPEMDSLYIELKSRPGSTTREVADGLRSGLHADRYAELADQVEKTLNLTGGDVDASGLGATDTFRFEEPLLLKRAIDQTLERFGALHGVIHSAGIAGGGLIQIKTREAANRVLAPKVHAMWALEAALGDRALDFLVLCSSTTAIIGGIGQVDYCAANAFLDAYAHYNAARLYATGGNSAIYYGLGVTEHSQGSTMVMGMANLAMATGNIGRRSHR